MRPMFISILLFFASCIFASWDACSSCLHVEFYGSKQKGIRGWYWYKPRAQQTCLVLACTINVLISGCLCWGWALLLLLRSTVDRNITLPNCSWKNTWQACYKFRPFRPLSRCALMSLSDGLRPHQLYPWRWAAKRVHFLGGAFCKRPFWLHSFWVRPTKLVQRARWSFHSFWGEIQHEGQDTYTKTFTADVHLVLHSVTWMIQSWHPAHLHNPWWLLWKSIRFPWSPGVDVDVSHQSKGREQPSPIPSPYT